MTQNRDRDVGLANPGRTNQHQPLLHDRERVGEAARGVDGAEQLFVLIAEEIVERAALIARWNARVPRALVHGLLADAVAAYDA
jgi:hypothetical protein